MNIPRCIDTRFIVPAWLSRHAAVSRVLPALLLSIAQFLLPALIAALGLLAIQPAKAADIHFYPTALNESFSDPFNWTNCPPIFILPNCFTGVPVAAHNVFFYGGVGTLPTYTVIFPESTIITNNNVEVGGATVAFALNSSTYNITNNLTVGVDSPYNLSTSSALTLSDGTVNADTAIIGQGSGFAGTLELQNSATLNASNAIWVGNAAGSTGTFTILDGSSASAAFGVVGVGGTGTASVDGLFSNWTVTDALTVGAFGSSNGTLTVTGGGAVSGDNSADINIGLLGGSTGAVTVSGTNSSLQDVTSLYVGGSSTGNGGSGTLTVSNGGNVDVNNTLKIWDDGTVTVDGNGLLGAPSTLNAGSIALDGSTAALNVTNNGLVTATNTLILANDSSVSLVSGQIAADSLAINSGTVTVDASTLNVREIDMGANSSLAATLQLENGATLNAIDEIWVGNAAGSTGTFTILDGSSASAAFGVVGVGGTGTASVVGIFSNWTVTDALTVGAFGSSNGTLTVTGGGMVSGDNSADINIGLLGGSTGAVTVSDTNSSLQDVTSLYVGGSSTGNGGSGTLTVSNGGNVDVNNTLKIWDDGTVTVDGDGLLGAPSTLNAGSIALDGSTAALNVTNNGLVTATTFLGLSNDSSVTVDAATLNVDVIGMGANSSLAATLQLQNGATLNVSNFMQIGSTASGKGNFFILDGSASAASVLVGSGSESTGMASVDGSGSTWTVTNGLSVGFENNSNGTLNITNGGTVSGDNSGSISIASSANTSGAVTVSGTNSSLQDVTSLSVGGVNGGSGTLTVSSSGSVDLNNTLEIWNDGTVAVDAATLNADSITLDGSTAALNVTNNGLVTATNALTLNNDSGVSLVSGQIAADSLAINSGTVTVDASTLMVGALRLSSDGAIGRLNISNGGQVSSASAFLGLGGNKTGFAVVTGSGSLWDNTGTVDVGGGGVANLGVRDSASVNVGSKLSIKSGGLVGVQGDATLNADSIELSDSTAQLNVFNNGLATVTNALTLNGGGVTVVGATLNAGSIDLSGSTSVLNVDIGGLVTVGNILEVGALSAVNLLTGGVITATTVDNAGVVTVFSDSSIFGDVSNAGTGEFAITNSSTLTLAGDLVHNGNAFDVEAGSTVIYQGDVSGESDFTGSGSHLFQGSFNPGNSPGLVNIAGDVEFGIDHTLIMELAGLTPGSEYDVLSIDGTATLSGWLDVDLLSGFAPSLGDSFDLLTAATLFGTFDSLLLPELVDLQWELQYLLDPTGLDTLRLSAVSAVPVPPAVWLFGSGLIGMVAIGRRRRDDTGGDA